MADDDKGGKIQIDPLFLALTRPSMFLGVSQTYVYLNSLINILYFIATSDFIALLVIMPFVHMIGYGISYREPLFIEIYFTRGQRCMKAKNRAAHGFTNTYDLFD